jgi:membrane protease subunit HflK
MVLRHIERRRQFMPWNDNSNNGSNPGPWGSPPPAGGGGKGGPTGGPGGGQNGGPGGPRRPTPPPSGGGGGDLDAMLRQLIQRLNKTFGGNGGGKGGGQGLTPSAAAAIAGVAFGAWALSGVYVVQPNEQAVVTTFGSYSRSDSPGLRYHLPTPIEKVEKVKVTDLNRIDIGGSTGAEVPEESLMLTGDENIVDLAFSVQWRVSDAAKYLFNVKDPDDAVKAVAESAMREVIGKTKLQSVLTNGRGQVQIEAAELMQKMLDRYGTGVFVDAVQIRNANPPKDVIDAFRAVATAGQDAQSLVNEANTYRNRVINEAKGDASRIVQSSQGYREQIVREADGEASRFNQIYGEYKRSPGVTRQRLYLETMERVLAKSNKVIVDGKNTSAPIILPPDAFRPRTEVNRPASAPSAPAAQSSNAPQLPVPVAGANP